MSFFAIAVALRCVYRKSMRGSLCPEIVATSAIERPLSKNRLMASCLRSWKLRLWMAARFSSRSQAIRKASAFMGKGIHVFRAFWFKSTRMAFEESGTSLEDPFLVNVSFAMRWWMQISSQRRFNISPRLMPVSIANKITDQTFWFLVEWIASSKFSYSSGRRRLSLVLGDGGSFISVAGFLSNMSPHSHMAILRQWRIIIRSYWLALTPSCKRLSRNSARS